MMKISMTIKKNFNHKVNFHLYIIRPRCIQILIIKIIIKSRILNLIIKWIKFNNIKMWKFKMETTNLMILKLKILLSITIILIIIIMPSHLIGTNQKKKFENMLK
jgi:hypothetical protein